MSNWKTYFTISGCNYFVMPGIGEINANKKNLPLERLLKAYKKGCPYIGLTDEGRKKYDPDKKPIEVKKIEHSQKEETTEIIEADGTKEPDKEDKKSVKKQKYKRKNKNLTD